MNYHQKIGKNRIANVNFDHGQYDTIRLATKRGDIDCRYYPSTAINITKEHMGALRLPSAAIFVTGVGGNWSTPADGLYPRLCNSLSHEDGISALHIRYRHPTDLDESIFDVLAGITFLKDKEGIRRIGLVGHSFGGAVVLQAVLAGANLVSIVVTLATQSFGAINAISKLRDSRVFLLLIHGTEDDVLLVYCSEQIHQLANEPEQLVILSGAGHSLNEASAKVYEIVRKWLISYLGC